MFIKLALCVYGFSEPFLTFWKNRSQCQASLTYVCFFETQAQTKVHISSAFLFTSLGVETMSPQGLRCKTHATLHNHQTFLVICIASTKQVYICPNDNLFASYLCTIHSNPRAFFSQQPCNPCIIMQYIPHSILSHSMSSSLFLSSVLFTSGFIRRTQQRCTRAGGLGSDPRCVCQRPLQTLHSHFMNNM